MFAGAGTGPVQKVERCSSSDKRQALGKDQDRAQTLGQDDF